MSSKFAVMLEVAILIPQNANIIASFDAAGNSGLSIVEIFRKKILADGNERGMSTNHNIKTDTSVRYEDLARLLAGVLERLEKAPKSA